MLISCVFELANEICYLHRLKKGSLFALKDGGRKVGYALISVNATPLMSGVLSSTIQLFRLRLAHSLRYVALRLKS